ncbi:hypothetical protein [Chitinimonas naiadis]
MTVIAYLEDLGLVFTDVMLSNDKPGTHFVLPTTGSTENIPQNLALSPTRLVRKYFRQRINGREGIFFVAGALSHIKKLIACIKYVCAAPGSLHAEYKRQLNSEDPISILAVACLKNEDDGFSDFEIIGFIDSRAFVRNYATYKVGGDLPYYGKIHIAGSGGQDLYNWLAIRAESYEKLPLIDESVRDKVNRTMNTVPMILLEEDGSTRAKTIINGVGGYYETFVFERNGLEGLDSVLTLQATVQGKGKNTFINIERLYFHKYVENWLVVVSLFGVPRAIHLGEQLTISMADLHIFKIPPVFESNRLPNWTSSKMASMMASAEHFRLTLRRGNSKSLIIKRFSEGARPCRRLLKTEVRKSHLIVCLDEDSFRHYLNRFPASLALNEQPLDIAD